MLDKLTCFLKGRNFTKEEAEHIYLCLLPCFLAESGYMLKLEKLNDKK